MMLNVGQDAIARQTAHVEGAWAAALRAVLKRMRAFHNPYVHRQAAWTEVAGEQAAAHAQVVGFSEGTLFIAVDSSVWRSELQGYMQASLLARLQADKRTADVSSLRFRLGTPAEALAKAGRLGSPHKED